MPFGLAGEEEKSWVVWSWRRVTGACSMGDRGGGTRYIRNYGVLLFELSKAGSLARLLGAAGGLVLISWYFRSFPRR